MDSSPHVCQPNISLLAAITYYVLSLVPPNMNQSKLPTQPRPVAPKPCYKRVYLFFLIYTPKGCIQVHMFTNAISVMFLELPTKLYSSKREYNEMTNPTKSISTTTKNWTVLQSLLVFLNTYS
jgi:hypothetical protein